MPAFTQQFSQQTKVVDSKSVQKRIEDGALTDTGNNTRHAISLQLINIRRSCHLNYSQWSDAAETALVAWLSGRRKRDRRTDPKQRHSRGGVRVPPGDDPDSRAGHKALAAGTDVSAQLTTLLGRKVGRIRGTGEYPPRISVLDVVTAITGKGYEAAKGFLRRFRRQHPEVEAKFGWASDGTPWQKNAKKL